MKPRYIIQGYQVSEIMPEEIVLQGGIAGPELSADEIQDYSIEDYLTDQEQAEAGFNCLKGYSAFEVEKVLMHPRADGDGSTAVLNASAWYALEETCRAYNDVLEAA